MITISKSKLKKYLLLLPIMKPGILSENVFSQYNNVYSLFRIVVLIAVVYMLIIKPERVILSKFTVAMCFYQLYILLVTLSTEAKGILVWAGPASAILTVTLLFDYYYDDLSELIECIAEILTVLIIINEISVLICLAAGKNTDIGLAYFNPRIHLSQYFLGMDNRFINYFFPAVLCSYITETRNQKNGIPKTKAILLVGTITLIILKAVGGMFGMILLSLTVLFNRYKSRLYIRIWMLILISILLSLSVVIVGCRYPDVLVDFFQYVALKGRNFFDRVRMWRGVYEKVFLVRPLTGIGTQSVTYMRYIMRYNHAHNLIMTLLLQGGIIGEVLAWITIFIGTKKLNMATKSQLVVLVSTCIFVELLTNIMDTTNDSFFFLMICIAANIDVFEKYKEKAECQSVAIEPSKVIVS